MKVLVIEDEEMLLTAQHTISTILAAGGTDYLVKADYTLKEVVNKILEIASRPKMKPK